MIGALVDRALKSKECKERLIKHSKMMEEAFNKGAEAGRKAATNNFGMTATEWNSKRRNR